jgi:D-alanyl-D-alanine dipeptidase
MGIKSWSVLMVLGIVPFLCAQEICRDLQKVDLLDVAQLDGSILLDIRYATPHNFTGKKIYKVARCLLARPAAEALVRVNQKLAKSGLVVKVFDAYRPYSCQQVLWKIVPDERYVANPRYGSRHNRGCAVDLTICDVKTGKPLEMPSEYDDFSEKAHRNYVGCSATAKQNRELLEKAMLKEGFIGLADEWWHFDYKDWRKYPLIDIPLEQFPENATDRKK